MKINNTHKSMSNIAFKYGKRPTEKEVERKGEELRGYPRKP